MNKTLIGFFVFPLLLGCGSSASPDATTATPTISTGLVTIEIDVDETVEVFEFPNVQSGTTLESLMRSMDAPEATISGTETTAFVQSIGGKETSPGLGWTFSVDGQFSSQGVGSTLLEPPTTVTWRYGAMNDASSP
jgi:hypothetical protein